MNRLFITTAATIVFAAPALTAQVTVDEYLRTAPNVTQTVTQTTLIQSWTPPAASGEDAWILTPSEDTFLVNAGNIASAIFACQETGTYSVYFPKVQGGLRLDLMITK